MTYNNVKPYILTLNSLDMIRSKYPFEYELIPESMEKGTQWLTLRLKNEGDDKLHSLDIRMHSIDSLHISFRGPNDFIYRLTPDEEKYLNFQVDAQATTAVYFSIGYFESEGQLHWWDSPWINEKVIGEVAELESVLVSKPYGDIGRDLEVEATVKGLGNSDGLDLEFWADTPSGKYEDLTKIKTKKLSSGEEASYTTKITPKDEGYYTIYANLYNKYRRIGRNSDTIFVW
jgi:hypothetical protein